MFKPFATILLIFVFAAQTFKGGIIMLDYVTNTEAFAKNCVNKARPKMHCNGKCQVVKKIQEVEKKDQQLPVRKFEKNIEIVFTSQSFNHFDLPFTLIANKAIAVEKNYFLPEIAYAFFHPPQA